MSTYTTLPYPYSTGSELRNIDEIYHLLMAISPQLQRLNISDSALPKHMLMFRQMRQLSIESWSLTKISDLSRIGQNLSYYGTMTHLKKFNLAIRASYASLANSQLHSLCQWLDSVQSNALSINVSIDLGTNIPCDSTIVPAQKHFFQPLVLNQALGKMRFEFSRLRIIFRGLTDKSRAHLVTVIPQCATAKLHRKSSFEFDVLYTSLDKHEKPVVLVKEIPDE